MLIYQWGLWRKPFGQHGSHGSAFKHLSLKIICQIFRPLKKNVESSLDHKSIKQKQNYGVFLSNLIIFLVNEFRFFFLCNLAE